MRFSNSGLYVLSISCMLFISLRLRRDCIRLLKRSEKASPSRNKIFQKKINLRKCRLSFLVRFLIFRLNGFRRSRLQFALFDKFDLFHGLFQIAESGAVAERDTPCENTPVGILNVIVKNASITPTDIVNEDTLPSQFALTVAPFLST